MMPEKKRRFDALNWQMVLAFVLGAFSFSAVNYWIYVARWWYIDTHVEESKPPTVSRAISVEFIQDPFAFWVTASGLCLIVSISLLAWFYFCAAKAVSNPGVRTRIALTIVLPCMVLSQVFASWGMFTLSTNSLSTANTMHMTGSYVFFSTQALVIFFYGVANHLFLGDRQVVEEIEATGMLSVKWMRWRRTLAFISSGLAVLYGALFKLKDSFPYPEYPLLYKLYVSMELAVISGFLFVFILSFTDKLRLPVRI